MSLTGVACPAVEKCIAVGEVHVKSGQEGVSYFHDANGWHLPLWGLGQKKLGVNPLFTPPPAIDPAGLPEPPVQVALNSISCTSITSCVAVGSTLSLTSASTVAKPVYVEQPLVETLAAPTTTPSWSTSPSGSALPAVAFSASLSSVSCSSPTSCQAVGSYKSGDSTTGTQGQQGLSETLSGMTWTPTTTIKTGVSGVTRSVLSGVSCSGNATNPADVGCLATGYYIETGHEHFLAQTLTQSTAGSVGWTPTAISDPPGTIDPASTALSCTSPSSCVAIGNYSGPTGSIQPFENTEAVPNATHFSVSANSAYVGVPDTLSVYARGVGEVSASTYEGTVHITSSDPNAMLPQNIAVSLDNGGKLTFPVTFETTGTQTVTVTDVSNPSITGTSAGISVTNKVVVPGEPSDLTASGGVSGIILAWKAPAHNGFSPVREYLVLRGTVSGGESQKPIAMTSGTAFVDHTVVPGVTYYYVVYAVNIRGKSGRSNEAFAMSRGNLGGGRRVTAMPSGGGYWLVGPDGGVFPFGSAQSYGSLAGTPLTSPVVALVSTSDGKGYWLVQADGQVHPYGDAKAIPASDPSAPVVAMAVTPDGLGYWLVDQNGIVYPFGDAHSYGSVVPGTDAYPTVSLSVTPDGKGYWMVDEDGTVHAFGDAGNYGSAAPAAGKRLNQPIISLIPTANGKGYWLTGIDGGVFAFGNAHFYGTVANQLILWPIVGMVAEPNGKGYTLVDTVGTTKHFGS
jgi:hypothetical protein